MNGGPYRAPQSSDRRVINGSGSAPQRSSDEPQTTSVEPAATTRRAPAPQPSTPKPKRRVLSWIIVILLVAILAVGGWFAWSMLSGNTKTGIDDSKYQAVFLSNGQIYFGKLHTYNDESLRLTTGYYPKAKATDSDSTSTEGDTSANVLQLVPLSGEEYGPEDEIFISKSQILHYENLKSNSKFSQYIDQNEKSK